MSWEDSFEDEYTEEKAIARAFEKERQKDRVQAWFINRVTPSGEPPPEIKQQWVDVPLPLRYDRSVESPDPMDGVGLYDPSRHVPVEDAISIRGLDAIKSLRIFGRNEAADYWLHYFHDSLIEANFETLLFIAQEGVLLPPQLANMLLPGLESFDDIHDW